MTAVIWRYWSTKKPVKQHCATDRNAMNNEMIAKGENKNSMHTHTGGPAFRISEGDVHGDDIKKCHALRIPLPDFFFSGATSQHRIPSDGHRHSTECMGI